MEALQILKFTYKKERLNFTAGMMTKLREQTVSHNTASTDDDLLAKLFTDDSEAMVDHLLNVFGQDDTDDEKNDQDNEDRVDEN
jgi:hypothetical protein